MVAVTEDLNTSQLSGRINHSVSGWWSTAFSSCFLCIWIFTCQFNNSKIVKKCVYNLPIECCTFLSFPYCFIERFTGSFEIMTSYWFFISFQFHDPLLQSPFWAWKDKFELKTTSSPSLLKTLRAVLRSPLLAKTAAASALVHRHSVREASISVNIACTWAFWSCEHLISSHQKPTKVCSSLKIDLRVFNDTFYTHQ